MTHCVSQAPVDSFPLGKLAVSYFKFQAIATETGYKNIICTHNLRVKLWIILFGNLHVIIILGPLQVQKIFCGCGVIAKTTEPILFKIARYFY